MRRGSGGLRWRAIILPVFAVACTSSGAGTGTLVEPSGDQGRVLFHWEGGATEGRIETVMPDGTVFEGRYVQVTQTIRDDSLAPLWDGWGAYWPNWDVPWGTYGAPDGGYSMFTRVYGGRVLATLESPSGERMRCRFTLAEPEEGLEGGAQGDCQLQDGSEIDYAVIGPLS